MERYWKAIRSTPPELAGAMALCFAFGWLSYRWEDFERFLAARGWAVPPPGEHPSSAWVLSPALLALLLSLFFGVLYLLNRRRGL